MIDLRSHTLPGVDDALATLDEARELARDAEGVPEVAATRHLRADSPPTPEQIEAGVAVLRADFAAQAPERLRPLVKAGALIHGFALAMILLLALLLSAEDADPAESSLKDVRNQ